MKTKGKIIIESNFELEEKGDIINLIIPKSSIIKEGNLLEVKIYNK